MWSLASAVSAAPAVLSPSDVASIESALELEATEIGSGRQSHLLAMAFGLLGMEPITAASRGDYRETSLDCPISPKSLAALSVDLASAFVSKVCRFIESCVIQKGEKSDIFTVWTSILPASSSNPYKTALADLILDPSDRSVKSTHSWQHSPTAQHSLLGVLTSFVSKVGAFLAHAEGSSGKRKVASVHSFVPLYKSLGESLERLHALLLSLLRSSSPDPPLTLAAVRCLSALAERCPYHKMDEALLVAMAEAAETLTTRANPVVQIAGLNLFAAVLAVKELGSPPYASLLQRICRTMLQIAFPGEDALCGQTLDNNVRYVALQNLGTMASRDVSCFDGQESFVAESVGKAVVDRDPAVALHALRLVRALGRNDPTYVENGMPNRRHNKTPSNKNMTYSPFIRLWMTIVQPSLFQALESRDDNSLKSALCDCLADMPESVFKQMPPDRHALVMAYILSHCSGQTNSAAAAIRPAAIGCIGSLLAFRSMQTDVSFLTDAADALTEVLAVDATASTRKDRKAGSKILLVAATWSLANLGEVLLQRLSVEPDKTEEASDNLLAMDAFPKHYVVRLLECARSQLSSTGGPGSGAEYLNVSVNCLRALGSLFRCCCSCYASSSGCFGVSRSKQAGQSQPESKQKSLESSANVDLLKQLISCVHVVTSCLRNNCMVKVRWNAAYAAGQMLASASAAADPDSAAAIDDVVHALAEAVELCDNFKVRIAAAAALATVTDRSVLAEKFKPLLALLLRCLLEVRRCELEPEAANSKRPQEEAEARHRADLEDAIALAVANAVCLSNGHEDMTVTGFSPDEVEELCDCISRCCRRVSPEKSGVVLRAAETVNVFCAADACNAVICKVFGQQGAAQDL